MVRAKAETPMKRCTAVRQTVHQSTWSRIEALVRAARIPCSNPLYREGGEGKINLARPRPI